MEQTTLEYSDLREAITVEEEKKHLIEILDWVVNICDKNKIPYYLAEGTLLGSVRHKGFIPWDDDIDLIMLRPDYIRFIDIAKDVNDERFYIAYSLDDSRHTRPFMRVYDRSVIIEESYQGATTFFNLNIDVFPSDGVPQSKFLYNIRCAFVRGIIGLASIDMSKKIVTKNVHKSIFKILLWPISKIVGYRNWYKLVDKIGKSISVEDSVFIGISVTPDCIKERIKKNDYVPQVKLEFEGKYYCAPKNYDLVLHNLYGNYMVPPPEGSRLQTHNRKFYKALRG